MYQWKNLFPLQGEQEHESSKPNQFGVYLSHLLGSFPFLQQSNKDQNLTWVTKKQDSDGYRGSDLEQQELLYLPHTRYVLHRKTVTTNSQNTTVKITKPIHPGVMEGRRKWEGKWHKEGEKSTQISPGTGAGKS